MFIFVHYTIGYLITNCRPSPSYTVTYPLHFLLSYINFTYCILCLTSCVLNFKFCVLHFVFCVISFMYHTYFMFVSTVCFYCLFLLSVSTVCFYCRIRLRVLLSMKGRGYLPFMVFDARLFLIEVTCNKIL